MRWCAFLALSIVPLLAGCNAYHPLSGGVGFTDVPLGQDAYRVTFTGDGGMPVAEARQYALMRAAELAVLRDQPYFEILDEQILIGYGTSYSAGTYYPAYGRYGGRYGRGYYGGYYSPGYVQTYMIPEVTLQVKLSAPGSAGAIPAAYLLRQAESRNVKLSPGVPERLATLPPVAGEVVLPPAPEPKPKDPAAVGTN